MIVSSTAYPRLLIPRWRSFAKTLKSCELSVPAASGSSTNDPISNEEFAKRLVQWRRKKDLITAARIVETALVLGATSSAMEAAQFLLGARSDATPLVRRQAELVIGRIENPHSLPMEPAQDTSKRVAFWRSRTRNHTNDPLAWNELSLALITQGRTEPAVKCMQVALHLSPENRHIFRAAARLFCHARDRDRAYELIRWNNATPGDPWLMAAEISLAQLTGRNPAFVKKGMEFLARGSALPRQITELAGAVATFFLNGDHLRRSKKLFLHSLADPTANSLAQAEWASPHFQGSLIDERRWHHASFANEALAQHAFREGDFETALLRCIDWISEEPFSARAFIAASLVASTLDDYNQAADFAKQGLRHNRKSAPLNNTLAFSLASKGELDAAEAVLRKFAPANDDHMSRLISEANHGLIAMRRGDLATGESIYRRVIFRFRQENKVERVATAYAYFAREAANAKHPQAVEILAEAKSWLAAHNYPLARRVIASTEKILTPDVMSSNRGIRRS